MKEKKLYSTAIIPNELYVHRDADRKLQEVILRMSKPAYISVARQMGKTNLLIQTVSRNYNCTENGKLECTENGNNSAQLFFFQRYVIFPHFD